MNQCGDTLWVFGVGKALEEAVRGAEDGKSHFGAVNDGGETFVMAIAGFAEEHGFDATAGAQGFFHKTCALDANASGVARKAAAECHAELF